MGPSGGAILIGLLAGAVAASPVPGDFGGLDSDPLDQAVRARLDRLGIGPVDPGFCAPPKQAHLGQLLFFDKVLSGNRDIACATCHHPSLLSHDGRSLPIGTLGTGLGPDRAQAGARRLVPRNSTEVFDRGSPDWRTMFWDSRVERLADGRFRNPAGGKLPGGMTSVLAVQAMFPVTSRDEMRGAKGDPGNEVAILSDTDFPGIWSTLMSRLWAIPAYRDLFAAAYPDVPPSALGFQHAAEAIAAFEIAAYTPADSPWDRYVAGNNRALSRSAKRGALLFYGRAGCVSCHSGPLLTDQRHHNLAVPQLGPGKDPNGPLDHGRGEVTHNPRERYAFRTPPLRNVADSGPWMHNGCYTTLEAAVRHHLQPVRALLTYDRSQLIPALRPSVQDSPEVQRAILATLDPLATRRLDLSEAELTDLLAFLHALTSPWLTAEVLDGVIPLSVPSGLPVDRLPPIRSAAR